MVMEVVLVVVITVTATLLLVVVMKVILVVVVVLKVVLVVVLLLVVVVVLVIVVVRALVCTGAVIITFIEVLGVGIRVDLVFMDTLTDIKRGGLTNIDVNALVVDVNVNVFADVMTAFEFVMSDPSERLLC